MKRMIAGLVFATMVAGGAMAQGRTPSPERIQGPPHEIRERHGEFRRMGPPPAGMPGMGAWWKNSEIAKELNLTDAQRKQLEQTFMDYRLKLVDLHADVERQELRLEPLINGDSLDENAVSQQLDQVVAARGRLEKTNAMMSVAMRKVLNQEQWKQLQSIHRMRAPRAPGMWGAPRGPIPPDGPTPAPAAPKVAPAPPSGTGPSESM